MSKKLFWAFMWSLVGQYRLSNTIIFVFYLTSWCLSWSVLTLIILHVSSISFRNRIATPFELNSPWGKKHGHAVFAKILMGRMSFLKKGDSTIILLQPGEKKQYWLVYLNFPISSTIKTMDSYWFECLIHIDSDNN